MRIVVAIAATLLIACSSPAATPLGSARPSGTNDALAAIRARGTLKVVVRNEAPAGGRANVDAAHTQKRGLEVAIANALAQAIIGANAKAELTSLGRERHVPVANGQADLAVTPIVADAGGVTFSKPYAAGGTVIVAKTGTVTAVEALGGKTMGTSPGELDATTLAQDYLKSRGVTPTVKNYETFRAAMEGLDKGEVAAVTGDRSGALVIMKEKPGTFAILAEVASRPFGVAARSDASALLAKVNEVLSGLIASGEIKKMAEAAGFPYELVP